MLMALSVMLAASFNLVIGYGGLISIAHPVFYAIGAYASALLARDAGLPVPLAIPAGAVAALLASVLVALPALRISGDYLLIASIGFQLGHPGGDQERAMDRRRRRADRHPRPVRARHRHGGLCRAGGGAGGGDRAAAALDHAQPVRPRDERDARRRDGLRRARPQRDDDQARRVRARLRRSPVWPAGSMRITSASSRPTSSTSCSRRPC